MAFYAPNIEKLETAPRLTLDNFITWGVVWEETLYESHFINICIILEEPISGHKLTTTTNRDINTYKSLPSNMNQGIMYKSGQDYTYFNDKDVVVKVGIKDSITSGNITEYTEALEGQTFHFYTPPSIGLNFTYREVLNKNFTFEFDYNSEYGLDYLDVKIYDCIVGSSDGLLELIETKRLNGNGNTTTTLSTKFANIKDEKSYAMVIYVKTTDGGEGLTSTFSTTYFYISPTVYYNNISIDDLIIESICHYKSGNNYYYAPPYSEFTINNSINKTLDLTTGSLKQEDDTYRYFNYYYTNRGFEPNKKHYRFQFSNAGNDTLNYYNIDNQQYKFSVLCNTANRPIETTEQANELFSNVENEYSYHYVQLTPNIEANSSATTLKLNNSNGYNFSVSFSQTANSIIDYAEFFITDNDRNILLRSEKVYNDRTDSSTLSLSHYFDLGQFEEDKLLKLYVKVKTIYNNFIAINSNYYKFYIRKWFNIDIVNVSYKQTTTTYSFLLDVDCEVDNAYVVFGLTNSNNNSAMYWERTPYYNLNNQITLTFTKSSFPSFTIENLPYYFQIGAKSESFTSDDINTVFNKSQKTVVYYIEQPTLSLNMEDGETIGTSDYTFLLNYNSDNEPLDYATFKLYDADSNLIRESDKLFNTENPPLLVYKYFNGFLNNTDYKISAYVKTFHGLEVETDLINFNIEYENPMLHAPLKLDSKCNDGYVEAKCDIFIGEGESNPSPMIYVDEGEKYSAYAIKSDPVIQYGRNTSSWVYWGKGVDINTNFVIKYWFSVGSINNDILRLYNDEGNYINVKFKRLNRTVTELNGDYIEVSSSENVIANSNILHSRNNGTNKYFLWIKVVNNTWEVILSEDSKEESIFNWNDDENNIAWNTTSDIPLYNETYEDNRLKSPLYEFNPNNFDKILVGNAICRQLEITNNVDLIYSDELDDWDEYMVLKCDFDQNLKGGNLDEQLGSIHSIRIKRYSQSTNSWITLYEKDIVTEEDLMVEYHDYIVPKGVEQLYALVPVMANGNEGEYITNTIRPTWNYCFISDNEQCFKLYSSISYGTTPQNKPVGTLNPIGKTYPIIIRNSDINYKSGVLSGQLMGYNYEKYHHLDRADVVKQTQDYIDFLTNGKTKVITDWNGNCWIVQVIDSPTTNYNIVTTNGITTVTFSWAEQGKYDNEEDLIENDLI